MSTKVGNTPNRNEILSRSKEFLYKKKADPYSSDDLLEIMILIPWIFKS